MKRYKKPLTAKELADLPDEAIDYSDIPELGEEFWQNAQLVMPEAKERITLRVDREVVEYFRAGRHGYQTRMNAVLRAYVDAQRGKKRQRTAR
ncbi:MAG: BrnA antitoxin family protein [Caldilineaceae bacterium]|nr:BrnA antitoxin family protein [Caldilineaceae bacterium]